MKVFISYKSDESAIVSKLYEDLIASGLDVWLDQKELPPESFGTKKSNEH